MGTLKESAHGESIGDVFKVVAFGNQGPDQLLVWAL